MQLPIGRTMQQCMGAAERVLSVHHPQPPNYFGLKRKSIEGSEQSLKRQAIMTPTEPSQPPRNIQPRPSANGFPPASSTNSSPSVPTGTGTGTATGTGKKRGRPSKADKEAQARAANLYRTMEYAPITPAPALAPLAPMSITPQRDYASSPGYEISGGTMEMKVQRGKIRGNENSPIGSVYPLASPASVSDIPRGAPEPAEQYQQQSPRDYAARQPADPGSASNHSHFKRSSASPALNQAQSLPESNTLPPIQASPRHAPEQYKPEPPRVIDPIFPDRDRSKSVFDPIPRATPPAQPLVNRS